MTTIKRIVHAQVCALISVEIWSEQRERGQVAHFARYLSLCLYRRLPESMTDRHVIPAQRRACAWECCGVAAFVGRMWEDTFLGPPATGPLQTNTDSVRRSPWKPQWHQQSREVKVPFVPSEEILGLTDKPEVGVWGLYFCRRHTSLFKKTVLCNSCWNITHNPKGRLTERSRCFYNGNGNHGRLTQQWLLTPIKQVNDVMVSLSHGF